MHVQVRLAAAVVMLGEQRRDRAGRVAELTGMRAVVAGANEQGALLGQGDDLPGGLDRGVVDRLDPRLVLGGRRRVAALARRRGGGGVAGLQQADGLGRGERQVVERHRRAGRAEHLRPGPARLGRRGELAERGDGRRRLLVLVPACLAGVPGRTAAVEPFPRRRYQLPEQGPVHLRVHLAGQAQRPGGRPRPHPGRLLAVLEVVRHGGPGRAQRVLDVMPCGYSQHPGVTVRTKIIYLMKASGACVRS